MLFKKSDENKIDKKNKILNFKRLKLKNSKKNEKIEILDFVEMTKYEKRKFNLKFEIKNKIGTLMTCLAIVLLLLTGVSLITGKNIVMVGVKRVLNGLGVYTEEVKKIEIQSDNYNESGSWHIDKSAKWIGAGKAQVTFNVNSVVKRDGNTKDIILVLDVSDSMTGEKLESAKTNFKKLISYLLSDANNRVALITFGSTSTIVSEFSNDKEVLLEKVSNLSEAGATNYNAAILNINKVMEGYVKENNRDVVTLFLTDGYPNEDAPNQTGTYKILRNKYPFMVMNGIQYEMGNKIIQEIKEITDNQWAANQSNLYKVLFEASVSPVVYEEFIVTDYIHNDYFSVNSASDIKVSVGKISLTEEEGSQKVVWNLGENSFMTGDNAKMTINLTLKEAYKEKGGYQPTNKKETITSKLPEETVQTISSTNTPVLKNVYQVIYDTNTPDGCTLEEIMPENHFTYSNVAKRTDKPTCDGYLFKGWDIDEKDDRDIKKINDEVFIMPSHDVTIRATWAKQNVAKTMDGTVHEKTNLYKVLQTEAEEGVLATEYTKAHQDSIDASGTEKIYHWYAPNSATGNTMSREILNKNNVIFAGQCWQMIRTTDTGGVKMIYNGEAEDGKCLNTRGMHIGYNDKKSHNLSGNYYYGTTYNYDKNTKTFTLAGDITQETWNASTYPNLIGKYTCKLTAEDGSCSTLYLVESYDNTSSGYVIPLNSNSYYFQIGKLQYHTNIHSPAYVGYMYNTGYDTKDKEIKTIGRLEASTEPVELNEYNAVTNNATYPYTFDESTKQWASNNHEDSSTSTFEFSPTTPGDYYLSFVIESEVNDKAKFYVDGVLKKTVSGSDTYALNLGTLTASSVIKVEYSKNAGYSSAIDQVKFSLARSTGETVDNRWKYGKNVDYKDGKYKLIDAVPLDLNTDYNELNTHHYTCLDSSESCEKVSYIHYANDKTIYYIQLENNTNVEQAINKMLHDDDVNKTNSTIKSGIDAWYERYLKNYADYLEDTIFCNNRSIRSLGGWNSNGGSIKESLQFKEFYPSDELICSNENDRFSTLNEKAKLKYPIGLMSSPEMGILGNSIIRSGANYYWLATPSYFDYYAYNVRAAHLNTYAVWGGFAVRPAISLKPGTEYSDGNGSMDNPYVVE